MASPQDIEKLKRNASETWEEAFQGIDKTSKRFHELVDEFVEFTGRVEDWSQDTRDRLADYIENLDDISSNWQKINTWIQSTAESSGRVTYSIQNLRNLFADISSDLGGIRRQYLDGINVARQATRVSQDNVLALEQEGGLTGRINTNLGKKALKLKETYYTQLRILGIKDPENSQAERIDLLEKYQDRLEEVQNQIAHLNDLKRAGIRVDNLLLKSLKDQEKQLIVNSELVSDTFFKGISDIEENTRRQTELYRKYSAVSAPAVGVFTRAFNIVGMGELSQQISKGYGEHVTEKVKATRKRELAQETAIEAKKVENTFRANRDTKKTQLDNRKAYLDNLTGEVDRIKEIQQNLYDSLEKLPSITQNSAGQNIDKKTGEYVSNEVVKQQSDLLAQLDAQIIKEKNIEAIKVKMVSNTEKLEREYQAVQDQLIAAEGSYASAAEDLREAEEEENRVLGRRLGLLSDIWKSIGGIRGLASAVFTVILTNAIKVDDLASKLRQRTGTWEVGMAAVNSQFASASDWLQMAVELADSFNIAPQTIFTPTEIGKMAEAKNLLGLSSEQAQNLGVYSKIVGQTSDQFRKSINQGFQSYNQLNRTAINYGNVQKEVLGTSDAIRLSYGGQGEALAKAANAALSIGMSMKQVESVMNNLIQFESSIESEMQAQLLTGKQLNLAKAREYALNNDIAGVVREINKQGIDAAWWGNANRIQQENMAKALGMSRDEMAKMIVQEELRKGASADLLARNMKVTEEEVKAMGMADTWKKSIEQLAQAFVPIIELIRPVVEILGVLASKVSSIIGWVFSLGGLLDRLNEKTSKWIQTIGKLVLAWPLIGRHVGSFFTGFTGGVKTYVAGLKQMGASLLSFVTLAKKEGFAAAAKSTFKIGQTAADTVADTANRAAQAQQTAGRVGVRRPGPLTRLGRDITGFVNALSKAKWSGIARAAVGIVIMSGAVALFGLAVRTFSGVDWSTVLKGIISLGALTAAFVVLGTVMSSGGIVAIVAGALAMGIMAGAVWILGKALQEMQKVDWGTIGKLPVAMLALSAAGLLAISAGLTLTVGSTLLLGAGGLMRLAGLSLTVAGALVAVGANLVAGALTKLSEIDYSGLVEGAVGLGKFGVALFPLAAGLLTSMIPLMLFPIGRLEKLSNALAPLGGLSNVAGTLTGIGVAIGTIAANLENLDTDKLRSLTALTTIQGLVSIFSRPKVETQRNVGDLQGIQQENITATAQEVTTKQAEIQANSQQISLEQKAADLSRIEQKMDKLEKAIVSSRPAWNWLEFGQEMRRQTPWMSTV